MSVETNSEIAREILSFALEGKVWPTGRKYIAAEWADTIDHVEFEDWEHVEPLPANWAPNILPEKIVSSEDIQEVLYKAAQIHSETGLPIYPNFKLPIEGVRVEGVLERMDENIPFPIRFKNCIFEDGIQFKDSHLSLLGLKHCAIRFISLKRAVVERSVVIEHCIITGGLNLRSAKIGGLLSLKRSRLSDGGGKHRALDLRDAQIGASVFLRHGFWCNGLTDLSGVSIKGSLDCANSTFISNKNGVRKKPIALRAKLSSIGGSVYLNRNFSALGEVDFRRSQIGAQMTVMDARLVQKEPRGQERPFFALNLENAAITQDATIVNLHKLHGDIGLEYAAAKTFVFRPEEWLGENKNLNGKIWLSGFKYDSVVEKKNTHSKLRNRIRIRIKWLNTVLPKHYTKTNFIRQPWEQLASVLKLDGKYAASDTLFIEAEERGLKQLRRNEMGVLESLFSLFFLRNLLILAYFFGMQLIRYGYGFGYVRVFYILVPLLYVNILAFGMTASLGYMKPAEEEITVYMETHVSDEVPDYYTHFNTLVYSIDLIVPFELGQASRWTPMTAKDKPLTKEPKDFINRQFSKIHGLRSCVEGLPKIFHWIPKFLTWISISAGWISVIVVGAAFAGQFRRDSH